jgi:nicotinate phosphoribosyltransferase
MKLFTDHPGLFTDLYELTMAQGYYYSNKKDEQAVFDYFFRKNPFNGGYVVFAGLQDLLSILDDFCFFKEDIKYLRSQGFRSEFLDFLTNFRFRGDIFSVREGEIVFPNEPVTRVEGNLIEAQIIETLLLNILNFQSLIATKASRIQKVTGDRLFVDFGLRRAQGFGGLQASRAAGIGGADATSNVLAGYLYDIPVSGTQAHSWIQSFDNELTAFRKYVESHPDNAILLVDTYDTLKSGVPNAIKVGQELKEKGHQLKGIRLDSGDLAYLSKKVRIMLDAAGLQEMKIFVSNQLDEYVIQSLIQQGAPINGFGVGTRLVTGMDSGSLDGVYKLSVSDNIPRLKLSESNEKLTLPGRKKIIRIFNESSHFYADAVVLDNEEVIEQIFHPIHPDKNLKVKEFQNEVLTAKVMDSGKIMINNESITKINEYLESRMDKLPLEHQRFENPHIYKVGISKNLLDLKTKIVKEWKNNIASKNI